MQLAVITPVGSGHEEICHDWCMPSVEQMRRSYFSEIWHEIVYDPQLEGASASRNSAIDMQPDVDWYLFVDADDRVDHRAIDTAAPWLDRADVVFGSICYDMGRSRKRVCPVDNMPRPFTFEALVNAETSYGTFSMGCFVRGELVRRVMFDVSIREGEDMDFFCALALYSRRFVKLEEPLVHIGRLHPSVDRDSSSEADWINTCDDVRARWRRRGPRPFTAQERNKRRCGATPTE